MAPVAAHCANPFLPLTNVWIFDQIRTLRRYRPVVLTQTVQNAQHFPFAPIFSAEQLPIWRRNAYRIIRKLRGAYAGYGRWLEASGACVMHAHFGQEGFRCLGARRAARIPMVTTFYGLDASSLPRQALWRRRFSRLFDEGELFLAEGPCMAERLVSIGCSAERLRIQHLGVDLDRMPFVPFEARRTEAQTILTYAAFREKKGLRYAVQAFAKIADAFPNARMRMIGDGPLRGELEAEAARLGVSHRVTMLGFLGHEAALNELRAARVLLYPSVTASDGDTEGGAPVALIESLATGTPVVSSVHADIPMVAPDGTCGLLFAERDVKGLAEGLAALLGSDGLCRRIAQAGRAHVAQQHDLHRQAEKLEDIYDEIKKPTG